MGERAPCHLEIGGTLAASAVPDLLAAIAEYHLSAEWHSHPFRPDEFPDESSLHLYGSDLNGGATEELDAFCKAHDLQFRRWSGSCYAAFNAEIEVCRGPAKTDNVEANDMEVPVFDAAEIERAGSLDALRQRIAFINAPIPNFTISPEPEGRKQP